MTCKNLGNIAAKNTKLNWNPSRQRYLGCDEEIFTRDRCRHEGTLAYSNVKSIGLLTMMSSVEIPTKEKLQVWKMAILFLVIWDWKTKSFRVEFAGCEKGVDESQMLPNITSGLSSTGHKSVQSNLVNIKKIFRNEEKLTWRKKLHFRHTRRMTKSFFLPSAFR